MYSDKPSFDRALRLVREARGMSQESLDSVSGRTYISALERGVKQPTIGKVAEIASALEIHPLTLLALSFVAPGRAGDLERLIRHVSDEARDLSARRK